MVAVAVATRHRWLQTLVVAAVAVVAASADLAASASLEIHPPTASADRVAHALRPNRCVSPCDE